MKKLSLNFLNKVYDNGILLDSWPCDIGPHKEKEINGSEENLICFEGRFYLLNVTWEGDIISGSQIDLNEELNLDNIGFIGKEIITYIKEEKCL